MAKERGKAATDTPEPIEAELRLAGDPEVLKTIFASSLLSLEPDAEEKISNLDSRYFDTPALDLRARGLAFRVRANGEGYKQTLKAGDDANAVLLKRGEWETALDDAHPRPDALPKGGRQHLPKAAFKGGLQETFATRMRRRARKVTIAGGGKIEAALDLGEISIGKTAMPIAEIELELLEGRPDTLYHLALELQKIGSLRLETRSKSTRAFDHLADKPPRWHTAANPPLDPADSVDQAMVAIFESCFSQWLANQAAAIDGRDPEGVHQLRVALRRLRSALAIFKKLIPDDELTWLKADARQAIGALGPARDWDVFQAELLAPVIEARLGDAGLIALRTRARARGRAGYRRARRHLEGPDYTRFVLRFGEWLERRAWRQEGESERNKRLDRPIADFAGKLLEKRHKTVLDKGRHFANLTVDKRHELRIALKKFRYSMGFVKPLFEKARIKPFHVKAKALQDDLGLLNDVAIAQTLLADLLARPGKQDIRAAAGVVIGWHAHAVAAIEPDIRRDWKAFVTAQPFWRKA